MSISCYIDSKIACDAARFIPSIKIVSAFLLSLIISFFCHNSLPAQNLSSFTPQTLFYSLPMPSNEESNALSHTAHRLLAQCIQNSHPSWFYIDLISLPVFELRKNLLLENAPLQDQSAPFLIPFSSASHLFEVHTCPQYPEKVQKIYLKEKESLRSESHCVCYWDEEHTNLLQLDFFQNKENISELVCSHLFFYDQDKKLVQHSLRGSLTGKKNSKEEEYTTHIQYNHDGSQITLLGQDGTKIQTFQSIDDTCAISICLVEGKDGTRIRSCTSEQQLFDSKNNLYIHNIEETEDDSPSCKDIDDPIFSWRRWNTITQQTSSHPFHYKETTTTGAYDPVTGEKILLRKNVKEQHSNDHPACYHVYDAHSRCIFSSEHGVIPHTLLVTAPSQKALCPPTQNNAAYFEHNLEDLNKIHSSLSKADSPILHQFESDYDSFGNMTKIFEKTPFEVTARAFSPFSPPDPLYRRRARYTCRNSISAKEYEDGSYESLRYFLNGRIERHKSRDNHVITYTYDDIGRVTTCHRHTYKKPSDCVISQIEYTNNKVSALSESTGKKVAIKRDVFGRITEYSLFISDTLFEHFVICYDAADRIISVKKSGCDPCETEILYNEDATIKNSYIQSHKDGQFRTLYTQQVYTKQGHIQEQIVENEHDASRVQTLYDDKGRTTHIRHTSLQDAFMPYTYQIEYQDIVESEQGISQPHIKEMIALTTFPDGSQQREVFDPVANFIKERTIWKNSSSQLSDAMIYIHQLWFKTDTIGSKRVIETIRTAAGQEIVKEYEWKFSPIHYHLESFQSGSDVKIEYGYDDKGLLIQKKVRGRADIHYIRDKLGRIVRVYSSDKGIDYSYTYDENGAIIAASDKIAHTTVTRVFDKEATLIQDGEEDKIIKIERALKSSSSIASLQKDEDHMHSNNSLDGRSKSNKSAIVLPDGAKISFLYNDYNGNSNNLYALQKEIIEKNTIFSSCSWLLQIPSSLQLQAQTSFQEKGVSSYGHHIEKSTVVPDLFSSDALSPPCMSCSTLRKKSWTQTATHDCFGFITQEEGEFCYSLSFLPTGDICSYKSGTADEEIMVLDSYGRTRQRGTTLYSYNNAGDIEKIQHFDEKFERQETELTYEYDPLGRVHKISSLCCDEQEEIEYRYDGFHRIQEIIRKNKNIKQNSIVEKRIHRLWFSQSEIGSWSICNDTISDVVLQVPNLFSPLKKSCSIAVELQSSPYYTITDSTTSSILGLVDETAKLVEEYRYSLFGQVNTYRDGIQISSDQRACSPWLFNGKRRLSVATKNQTFDMYDYGFRRYLPHLFHFIESDLLGLADGLNTRRFSVNNPINYIDPTGGFSLPTMIWDFTKSLVHSEHTIFKQISRSVTFSSSQPDWFLQFRSVFEDIAFRVISSSWMTLIGYNPDSTHIGQIAGAQNLYPKVRITHINGILNGSRDQVDHASVVAKAHGNIPVHYVYAATSGFTSDLLRAACAKSGIISKQARLLAALWKKLLQEMGGKEAGATIIHYAHSLGGTDTANAITLMTREEQSCIRIVTFGSATLIEDGFCQRIDNYVSVNDGIPITDLYSYFKGITNQQPNIHFLSSSTLPAIDHLFTGETYKNVLEDLGSKFQEEYLKK